MSQPSPCHLLAGPPRLLACLACGAALLGCRSSGQPASASSAEPSSSGPVAQLALTSSAFGAGASIPAAHTCEGKDASPPLSWSGLPAGTKSVALIVDDPDAPDPAKPQRTWVHWVLYDIPPDTKGLAGGAALKEGEGAGLPKGTRVGTNDWKRAGWGGACPPIGRHRYFHKLYALDTVLPDLHAPAKAALLEAMKGHVIGRGELIGTYQKTGK